MINKRMAYWLILPAILFIMVCFFLPAVYNIFLSFTRFYIFRLQEGPQFSGFKNYAELIRDPVFPTCLYNTFFRLTIVTVSIRLLLGLTIALLFNASVLKRLRIMGVARTLLLIPWLTPQVVSVVIWKWLYHETYGAVNIILVNLGLLARPIPFFSRVSTVWIAVDTILVWRELPFVVIVLLAGLQSIPEQLYEASKIDGANKIKQFFYITLPQLGSVLSIAVLLTTFWTFNNFVYVWLSTEGGPGNYTHVLASYIFEVAFRLYEWGYAATLGTVMAGMMAVFALLYLKFVGKRSLFL